MPKIFFNKYTNWEKDLTYSESQRKDLSYYTLREFTETEYSEVVNMWIEEVKKLIDNII